MAPRKSGSDTDPSTVSGIPSSELGGGGGGVGTLNNPLRNIFPAGWIENSENQSFSGIINPLPSRPPAPDGYTNVSNYLVFEHPSTGDMVVYGLFEANTDGQVVPSLSYDFKSQEWSVGKYPDIGPSVGVNTRLNQSGVAVSGDTVVVVGGRTQDGTGSRISSEDLLVLDTSASSPSWTREQGVLPTGVEYYPAVFSYDGAVYSLIDSSDVVAGDSQARVVKYEVDTGNFSNELILDGSLMSDFSSNTPVIDGEAYLMGYTESGTDIIDGPITANGLEFYKYNIEDKEFTRLADMDVLKSQGRPAGEFGFGYGDAHAINDELIYYTDGYQYFDEVGQAVYSIEKDKWAPLPFLPKGLEPYGDATPYTNWFGAKGGVNKNGVLHIPTGSNDPSKNDTFQMFLPETFPEE